MASLAQASEQPEPAEPDDATTRARALPTRRVPSVELFAGALEIEIEHREQVYRLRQTALGKLILTK